MSYDCPCRRHRPPATTVLPNERYVDVDPPPKPPSTAQTFCAAWMTERERQWRAQEKRRGYAA